MFQSLSHENMCLHTAGTEVDNAYWQNEFPCCGMKFRENCIKIFTICLHCGIFIIGFLTEVVKRGSNPPNGGTLGVKGGGKDGKRAGIQYFEGTPNSGMFYGQPDGVDAQGFGGAAGPAHDHGIPAGIHVGGAGISGSRILSAKAIGRGRGCCCFPARFWGSRICAARPVRNWNA